MRRIFFMRHGNVDNPNKVVYGRLPGFPLSETGIKEVTATADQLGPIVPKDAIIIASPLLRTVQTAMLVQSKTRHPLFFDERLSEIWQPIAQGQPLADYLLKHTDEVIRAPKPYHDEPHEAVGNRVKTAVHEWLRSRKTLVVITHEDTMSCGIAALTGISYKEALDLTMPTACVYELTEVETGWKYARLEK